MTSIAIDYTAKASDRNRSLELMMKSPYSEEANHTLTIDVVDLGNRISVLLSLLFLLSLLSLMCCVHLFSCLGTMGTAFLSLLCCANLGSCLGTVTSLVHHI